MKAVRAFTLIELLVVLAIVALLSTLALPRYFNSIDTAKDTALRESLHTLRGTIDKFYGDTGRYPDTLAELVEKKYLRGVPVDPWTESASTWILVAPEGGAAGRIYDVRSGARGATRDGKPYAQF